eukprot:4002112-Prymnesium_polylepis.1
MDPIPHAIHARTRPRARLDRPNGTCTIPVQQEDVAAPSLERLVSPFCSCQAAVAALSKSAHRCLH